MSITRPNILVVCGRKRRRSLTAESIFKYDSRFSIRSAGLSPKSDIQLTEEDIRWADLIFVMEAGQRAMLWSMYRHLELPPIEILDIEDDHDFGELELHQMLTERINDAVRTVYNL